MPRDLQSASRGNEVNCDVLVIISCNLRGDNAARQGGAGRGGAFTDDFQVRQAEVRFAI